MWVNVPRRYPVRIPGDGQVTVPRRVDPVRGMYRVVVDGLIARPCRIVHAQDGSEHAPGARRVVVRDFRRPHVVRSCSAGTDTRAEILLFKKKKRSVTL